MFRSWPAVSIAPYFVGHAGDASGRLFVVEKQGRILVVQNGQVRNDPFLDITDRVRSQAYEQGLFSVAFHPGYPTNGRIFVDYTDHNGDTVVSEFTADAAQARANPQSERVLLQIEQPYENHNGGMIAFGPRDGYLYISAGDGGSGGDPLQHGQNPSTLLGSLLRIDVDTESGYAIPVDNPFASQPARRAEIFAYGLRNVWRFSFDRVTGDLWLADVGQNDLEEVPSGPGAVARGASTTAGTSWKAAPASRPLWRSARPRACRFRLPNTDATSGVR